MAASQRDDNGQVNISGVSSISFSGTVEPAVNPTTHELLVSATSTDVSPTAVGNGKKTVTTAGTRVALASSTTCKSVTIKSLSTNTGIIYVGDSTVTSTNGFQLYSGDAVSFDISNLSTIYLDSSVNGEGVTYLYVN